MKAPSFCLLAVSLILTGPTHASEFDQQALSVRAGSFSNLLNRKPAVLVWALASGVALATTHPHGSWLPILAAGLIPMNGLSPDRMIALFSDLEQDRTQHRLLQISQTSSAFFHSVVVGTMFSALVKDPARIRSVAYRLLEKLFGSAIRLELENTHFYVFQKVLDVMVFSGIPGREIPTTRFAKFHQGASMVDDAIRRREALQFLLNLVSRYPADELSGPMNLIMSRQKIKHLPPSITDVLSKLEKALQERQPTRNPTLERFRFQPAA